MKNVISIFCLTVFILSACASVSTSKSADSESYKEDLGKYRPSYAAAIDTLGEESSEQTREYENVTPTQDVTDQLNSVLDGTDELKKDVDKVDGFTIQIYVGKDTDEARKIRGMALSMLPDELVELYYDEPSFKVKVGQYFTRSEARNTYAKLRSKFPTALIIPDKIPVP
jgi:hypothetical protein